MGVARSANQIPTSSCRCRRHHFTSPLPCPKQLHQPLETRHHSFARGSIFWASYYIAIVPDSCKILCLSASLTYRHRLRRAARLLHLDTHGFTRILGTPIVDLADPARAAALRHSYGVAAPSRRRVILAVFTCERAGDVSLHIGETWTNALAGFRASTLLTSLSCIEDSPVSGSWHWPYLLAARAYKRLL